MYPSQSDSLMKSFIFLDTDSLQCDTFVLIDSAATLRFLSQISLNQNGLVGKRVQGRKIVAHNALK